MDVTALFLVLLLQLSTVFGSALVLKTKDCGNNNWVAYSYSSHGQELFYINGNVVNKVDFCKALQLYIANGCNVKEDYYGSNNCALDASFVNLPSKAGRKLLQKDLDNNSTSQGVSKPVATNKVGIFAGGGALLVCCAVLCPCFYGKRQKATAHAVLAKDPNSMDSASSFEPSVTDKIPASPFRVPPSPSRFSMSPKISRLQTLNLNLSQVARATRNFSETLQIGEGGFGTVYKAKLDDGVVVAVKRAKREHFESLRTEFSSEVELLAKIDHRNLVKLLGYIDTGSERLLITEYVRNGTLREHLDVLHGKVLDFNQRLEIAIDVAHGLTYLHQYAEKQIIHRDVKASNILLTESMRAKVADFGFARLGPVNTDQTHISTKVKGTVGYLDPDFFGTACVCVRERMRYGGGRRRRMVLQPFLVLCAMVTGVGLLMLALRPLDPPITVDFPRDSEFGDFNSSFGLDVGGGGGGSIGEKPCATVEQMGKDFEAGLAVKESLRVRRIIEHHFVVNGASRVRDLPPGQFCSHGFVLGKTAEAGFGNEMYKILTAAALSIMLNRSLIIGQTRGKYPFGDYISYSNFTFTMKEIKHLWRQNGCESKYGRQLVMRTDDFEKPAQSNVLCSNWNEWEQPIIWFQGTTDAMAAQFFLKNIHSQMRIAAFNLFGDPQVLGSQPNVFGELMRVLISPTKDVEAAVDWVIGGEENPDISLHMRMLMNRSIRAVQAALHCIRKAIETQHLMSRPKVVVVSDTPSLVKSIVPNISEFAEVLHFDYEKFKGRIFEGLPKSDFRVKDWGPAPRWVAFVDFFLASRARYTVVSGAHRRVGTTYAQLIAALAAARNLGDNSSGSSFSFFSSFHSNLLTDGLRNQIGWGHVWNRYAGPLSCFNQSNQCAFTPLLPPAWYDGLWQSPIPRDTNRLASFGVQLSGLGTVDSDSLRNYCDSRKSVVRTVTFNL